MEQHPIPQNISSYQFRLVGDMTLKQFFQLAGGILIGLIFYSSPLLVIIKWPFTIVSVILGVALAFLPLEERPLEKWIFAFFRAIYSPTLYYWKKSNTPYKFFQDEPSEAQPTASDQAIEQSLGLKTTVPTPLTKLEEAEQGFLSKLAGIFSGNFGLPAASPLPQNPLNVSFAPAPPPSDQVQTPSPASPAQASLVVPQSVPVKVVADIKPRLVVEEKNQMSISEADAVSPVIKGEEIVSTKMVTFSPEAAPPNPPTIANVVVGQVMDADGKIVEGAIIEIKDSYGRPVRALKSNRLGHFIIVTPLEDGKYDVITEKDGLTFHPASFTAQGDIIPPILIKGEKLIS